MGGVRVRLRVRVWVRPRVGVRVPRGSVRVNGLGLGLVHLPADELAMLLLRLEQRARCINTKELARSMHKLQADGPT